MSTLFVSLLLGIQLIGQAGAVPSIAGMVVAPDGKPVGGAEVALTAGVAVDGSVPILSRATTDASGSFRIERPAADRRRGFMSPGVIWVYKPGMGLGVVDLLRADRPDEVHRLVLEPQQPRRLTLRDADGQPVVGASVAARLVETERTGYLGVTVPDAWLARLTAVTDAQGDASLPGLTRLIELRSVCIATPGGGKQIRTLLANEGKHDAALSLGRPSRLAGAIRDASGAAVANVPVEVWARCGLTYANQRSAFVIPEAVRFDGGSVRTDDSGSFQTPAVLRTGSTYRVVVRAAGFAPAVSDWITLRGESQTLPPLTIRSLRTLVGQVIDRQRQPIAGVQVFQPGDGPSATTDEAGRFRMVGLRSGRSLLIARRDGFRLSGTSIVDNESDPVELTMSRPGEPPDRIMATLSDPIPRDEARSLSRRVLGPYLKQVLAKGDDGAKLWSLRILRWLDPPGLLDQVQKTHFDRESTSDYLRGEAALGLFADDPDEAAAIAETIADPANRTGTLVDLADLTPAADRARKLALLDRAALQARGAALSSNKLFQMGEVAERWLELGEREKAVALFAEGRKLVEALPPQKRTDAGMFQAHLARVEPDAALALIKDVGPMRWRQRIYGNIAIRLAFEHPAEAEAVLHQLEEPIWRIYGAPRICRRLVRNDLPRARRIAASLPNPSERAYAWTFLADGLSAVDRTAASAALDQALRELDSIDPEDASPYDANPAGSILPLVVRIAPDRVAEVFWRAVALHAPLDDPRTDFGRDDPLPAEALLLSRYDRDVAATLFEPVAAFVRSRSLRDGNDIIPVVLLSLTCLDPRTAVGVVEGLPPAPTLDVNDRSNWARVTVAETLALPPDRRWMSIWRFHSGCGIAMFEEKFRDL
ncbi:MAG: carboxypeptidase regulatory-like domain-containing protein [Isosphaeraceae bacterium]